MAIHGDAANDATNKGVAEHAVNYGVTDALSPFPLHILANTMTATINNNTISQNMADTLPVRLRLVDPKEFSHGTTTSMSWRSCH